MRIYRCGRETGEYKITIQTLYLGSRSGRDVEMRIQIAADKRAIILKIDSNTVFR